MFPLLGMLGCEELGMLGCEPLGMLGWHPNMPSASWRDELKDVYLTSSAIVIVTGRIT